MVVLTDRLQDYRFGLRMSEQGTLTALGDGIAWIRGLPSAAIDDTVRFEDGSHGLIFHLGQEMIGAILLEETQALASGAVARLTGQRLAIKVGDALLGRVIDPLGRPLDNLPAPHCQTVRELDMPSPPITARDFVNKPLLTGNKIVDTLIPIGKGQRQLLIGDNGTGKSTLALDTVINQRGKGVRCVYVMIGQKRSDVVSTLHTLRQSGALAHTTLVVAEATAMPGLKYLAPFAGCTVAEAWMWQGQDTLVVYDDLSTHARAYRELSLLLRRPPGREAYPGDIFYLHSRLLERSTCLAPAAGGGSMTALPIIETEQGEIASYIPTNLISITDGQVYLDRRLFTAGLLPAIDVTRSVSRIGGKAQHPRIKEEAGQMKLDYLQFLELEVFTRFGSKLEASMEAKIRRGRQLREILKQDRLAPMPIEFQLGWLMAYNSGACDTIPTEELGKAMKELQLRLEASDLTLDDSRERWRQEIAHWCGSSEQS